MTLCQREHTLWSSLQTQPLKLNELSYGSATSLQLHNHFQVKKSSSLWSILLLDTPLAEPKLMSAHIRPKTRRWLSHVITTARLSTNCQARHPWNTIHTPTTTRLVWTARRGAILTIMTQKARKRKTSTFLLTGVFIVLDKRWKWLLLYMPRTRGRRLIHLKAKV